MPIAFRCGIAGGIWAVIVGIFYLVLFFSPEGDGFGFGFGASPDLWWLFTIFILAILAGAASLIAIMQRDRRPRLAFTLIWLSVVGIFPAFWFMDPVTLGILELPAIGLLFPAAVRMRQPRISSAFISGIAGGIWAIVPGFFSSMRLLFFSQPAGFASKLIWRLSIFSILVMLMGVLALVAIALHVKTPRFALALIWLSITGIIVAFWAIVPGPVAIFGALPAVILLIPAAIKMSRQTVS